MNGFCRLCLEYFNRTKSKPLRILAVCVFLVHITGSVCAQSFNNTPPPSSAIGVSPVDSLLSVTDSTYRQVIRDGSRSMNCYLSYPQGGARILDDFGNNRAELSRLDLFLGQVIRDSLIYVDSITLCGYCSIEGSLDLNTRLARSRAFGFRKYLDGKYALSSRYPVSVTWVAEDWETLSDLVAASDMEYRDEVLALIRDVDVNKGRETKLMSLRGGVPYRYMMQTFFPALRRVEVVINYDLRRILEEKMKRKLSEEEYRVALERERAAAEAEERRLAEEARRKEAARIAAEEAARKAAEQAAREREAARQAAEAARLEAERQAAEAARLEAERQAAEAARQQRREDRKLPPRIGVKTNLTAWAGLCPDFSLRTFMPNLEAEYYFEKRWSVSASALYANWTYGGGRHFFGLSCYGAEGRFWIHNDGLFRGFFVGVYGLAGDFNFQRNRRDGVVTTDNRTGSYWSTGIAAGYLQPLSRHWNLELELRGGYRRANYDRYDRELPHLYYSSSDHTGGFALTGLRLNIVYRFGRGKGK